MKEIVKAAFALLVITLIAGFTLGFAYQVTKEPIAMQKEKRKMEAYTEVFTDAAAFQEFTITEDSLAELQLAYSNQSLAAEAVRALDENGKVIGYVLTVTAHEGYNGDITFSMGIRMDGTINGISILSIAETPGLGMKADSILKPQFAGRKVEEFIYTKMGAVDNTQIDVISGATMTTDAMVNGVNAGLFYFRTELLEGGGSHE